MQYSHELYNMALTISKYLSNIHVMDDIQDTLKGVQTRSTYLGITTEHLQKVSQWYPMYDIWLKYHTYCFEEIIPKLFMEYYPEGLIDYCRASRPQVNPVKVRILRGRPSVTEFPYHRWEIDLPVQAAGHALESYPSEERYYKRLYLDISKYIQIGSECCYLVETTDIDIMWGTSLTSDSVKDLITHITDKCDKEMAISIYMASCFRKLPTNITKELLKVSTNENIIRGCIGRYIFHVPGVEYDYDQWSSSTYGVYMPLPYEIFEYANLMNYIFPEKSVCATIALSLKPIMNRLHTH